MDMPSVKTDFDQMLLSVSTWQQKLWQNKIEFILYNRHLTRDPGIYAPENQASSQLLNSSHTGISLGEVKSVSANQPEPRC